MPISFPYTFYACPCSENDAEETENDGRAGEDSGDSFNPQDPRSAYALSTLDHLLFCDDCNQIRCARCVSEEVLNWYCPNCLFETHSTGVRAEGNRCSRNCYSCPSCTSTAIVVRHQTATSTETSEESKDESYILMCQYCCWTSLEAGLRFNKPNKITEQMNQIRKSRLSLASSDGTHLEHASSRWQHDERFIKLSNFYREQLADSNDMAGHGGSGSYGSPANLARIIQMYGGLSHKSLTKAQARPKSMQEANADEGLLTYQPEADAQERATAFPARSYASTSSIAQQDFAPINFDTRSPEDLWPVATKLRTRRGKRCRQCRQFVVRPETKTTALRYKIRILARSHIPRLDIRPLHAAKPIQHPDFVLRNEHVPSETLLNPYQTYQYVLRLRNPIFETVKVTLATPGITAGEVSSKVTILCPSFTIGPAGDVWEEALAGSAASMALTDGGPKAAMASLTGTSESDRQPEAGKVWEQTRNSTSVILEVVAGSVNRVGTQSVLVKESGRKLSATAGSHLLEIPISVHVEWTTEGVDDNGQKGKTESRELQYWCVVGVGRIAEQQMTADAGG